MSANSDSASRVAVPQELLDKVKELVAARKRRKQAEQEEKVLALEVQQEMDSQGIQTVNSGEGTAYIQHRQFYAKINPAVLREKLGDAASGFMVETVDEKALEKNRPDVLHELRKVERESAIFALRLQGEE